MKKTIFEKDGDNNFVVQLAVLVSIVGEYLKKDKKNVLEKIKKGHPKSKELQEAIKTSDSILEIVLKPAIENFKQSLINIKDEFKTNSIQKFFGLGSEKYDSRIIVLDTSKKNDAFSISSPSKENLNFRDITNPGFDISPFIFQEMGAKGEKKEKIKKVINKFLEYDEILKDKTEKKSAPEFDIDKFISNIQAGNNPFSTIVEKAEDNPIAELVRKIAEKKFETYKDTVIKANEGGILDSNKLKKIIEMYRKEPSIILSYDFGKEQKIQSDPFLQNFEKNKLNIEDSNLPAFLKEIAKDNDLSFDDKEIQLILQKEDTGTIYSLFMKKEKTEKPASMELIRDFLNRNKEKIKNVQKDPPLFVTGRESEDLGAKTFFKIDDVYLIGNEYFKGLSQDEEAINVLQGLVNKNPNMLKKTSDEKIKEVHEKIKNIEQEKLKEQKKDLKKLYKYTLDNEQEVMDSFNINADKYEQTWQALENAIQTSDANETAKVYKFYYEFLKDKKPQLLSLFKSEESSSGEEKVDKSKILNEAFEDLSGQAGTFTKEDGNNLDGIEYTITDVFFFPSTTDWVNDEPKNEPNNFKANFMGSEKIYQNFLETSGEKIKTSNESGKHVFVIRKDFTDPDDEEKTRFSDYTLSDLSNYKKVIENERKKLNKDLQEQIAKKIKPLVREMLNKGK